MPTPTQTKDKLSEERGEKVSLIRGHILNPFASVPTIPGLTNPPHYGEVGC